MEADGIDTKYSQDTWSDEVLITLEDGNLQSYKSHLAVDELTDGSFAVSYLSYNSIFATTMNAMTCDKLGGSRVSQVYYDLPEDLVFGYHGSCLHFDEGSSHLQYIGISHGRGSLIFKEVSADGNNLVLDEDHIHKSELFPFNTTSYSFRGVYAVWDEYGAAHVVGSLERSLSDPYARHVIFYLKVIWHPFHVRCEVVHTIYQTEATYSWPKLGLTRSIQPVVTVPEVVGSLYFRSVCVRNTSGSWPTH